MPRRLGILQAASLLVSLSRGPVAAAPLLGFPSVGSTPGSAWMLCKHTIQDSPRNFKLPVDKKLSQLIFRKTAGSSNPRQIKKINSSEFVYCPRRKPAPSHQTTSTSLLGPISVQGLNPTEILCLSSEHGPLLSVPNSVCRLCRAVCFSNGLVITYKL